MNYAGLMGDLAAIAAVDAVRLVRLGELGDLGAAEDYIGTVISQFMDQQGPALADKLAAYLEPATQKAVDVIKPTVMQALSEYTPTFAAVAGGMVAVSVLAGAWIARREFRKAQARR